MTLKKEARNSNLRAELLDGGEVEVEGRQFQTNEM